MYAVTTRSSVGGRPDCWAGPGTEKAVTVRSKTETMTASLFTCDSSLHFEIAQRHALVELFILDMKLNVVVTGPGNGELCNVNSGYFSNTAHRLRRYL